VFARDARVAEAFRIPRARWSLARDNKRLTILRRNGAASALSRERAHLFHKESHSPTSHCTLQR